MGLITLPTGPPWVWGGGLRRGNWYLMADVTPNSGKKINIIH